jgi:transposase-like protein
VPAGRPSKLTPELVEQVGRLAERGLPIDLIADLLDVHRATFNRWIKEADDKGEGSLEQRFRAAIFTADAEQCSKLLTGLQKSASDGNAWSATWLLTHHPRLRDHFSDAAAERKTERRTVATVLEAVAATGLTPDQEHTLMLQMQARGLGAVQVEGEG